MSWSSGIQIRVVDGPGEGDITVLNFDRMTFGRARTEGAKADGWVLLADKAISRRHAELVWDDVADRYNIQHLSKTNLTWVDGQPLEDSRPLNLGQKIRMGGTTLLVETASTMVLEEKPTPARAGKHEMTERLSVEGLRQAIALKKEDTMSLKILSGDDQGQIFRLKGFHITVGRDSQQRKDLVGDSTLSDFDNMIELKDEGALPNHLVMKWDELRGGFSIAKNPAAPPVPVIRNADGFVWSGELKDKGALVREGDVLTIGDTQLTISKPGQEPEIKKPVKSLSL